jgi:hypothetical protein
MLLTMDTGDEGVIGVEGVDEGVPLILLATTIMAFFLHHPTTQQYLNLNLSLSFLYTTLLLLFIAHWI